MSKTLLLVGTRKGASCSRATPTGATGRCAARTARAGPSTTRCATRHSGTIYAAAASEWHGSAVWRSTDLGETWALSSEGLAYDGRRTEALEGLDARRAQRPRARRRRGAAASSRAATAARRGRCSRRSPDSRAARCGTTRPTSRPGHLGISALMPDDDATRRFWAIVQGVGVFETTDDGDVVDAAQPRASAPTGRAPHEEVGFCVHKLVRRRRHDRMYQQNHVGVHRSDDGGHSWTEITEGLPSEFGFAAAAHPARPRHLLRRPARPRPRAHDARRQGRGLAHARRGLELAAARRRACRSTTRTSACSARRWRSTPTTSPGPLLRHEHGPGLRERRRGRELERDRELPAADLVGRGRGPRLMAELHLPGTLTPLFAGPAAPRRPRRGDGRRGDRRARGSAGPACATACASRARRSGTHIHVYVDRERARLDTPLAPRSRVDVIAAISGG